MALAHCVRERSCYSLDPGTTSTASGEVGTITPLSIHNVQLLPSARSLTHETHSTPQIIVVRRPQPPRTADSQANAVSMYRQPRPVGLEHLSSQTFLPPPRPLRARDSPVNDASVCHQYAYPAHPVGTEHPTPQTFLPHHSQPPRITESPVNDASICHRLIHPAHLVGVEHSTSQTLLSRHPQLPKGTDSPDNDVSVCEQPTHLAHPVKDSLYASMQPPHAVHHSTIQSPITGGKRRLGMGRSCGGYSNKKFKLPT